MEYPRNIDDNITNNYKTKTVPQNGEGMRSGPFEWGITQQQPIDLNCILKFCKPFPKPQKCYFCM